MSGTHMLLTCSAIAFMILSSILQMRHFIKVTDCDELKSIAFLGNFQKTAFDRMVESSFQNAHKSRSDVLKRKFNLRGWKRRSGNGGLTDNDRTMIARYYSQVNSVFEFGVGESTQIASHVGVERYSGLDSDPVWLTNIRLNVQKHFRFFFADIGDTKRWGFPKDPALPKSQYDYEILPLRAEPKAFDVYFVDGRYRVPSLLTSALHSSAHGGGDTKRSVFMLHDCYHPDYPVDETQKSRRQSYQVIEEVLEMVDHSKDKLCVFQRKNTTTDDQILDLWRLHAADVN